MALAYNIPVDIPQVTGAPAINLDELKTKVQNYVNSLYVYVSVPQASASQKKSYSPRIQQLRAMSHKVAITEDDVRNDERLAYLLSK